MSFLFSVRRTLPVPDADVGLVQFLFIPLALLAAFLTLGKPYSLILAGIKSFYDMALLLFLFRTVRGHSNAFLAFNASMLYVVFSLLLFCMALARASLFTYDTKERDLQLLLSRHFLGFLFESLLFVALALSLYYLWPSLLAITQGA